MRSSNRVPSAVLLALAACTAFGCAAQATGAPEAGQSGAPPGSGAASGVGSAGGFPGGGGASGGGASGGGHTGGTTGASPPCTGDSTAFATLSAKVAADLKAHGVKGGALTVVCGGSTVFATGLGDAKAGGPAVTEHTRFQLASTTKTLTGALAARLAEKGALGLDDPVSKWLPYLNTMKPYSQGFTLAQLLAHTSGYPAGIDTALYQDLQASFQANADVELWSPPGEVFNYSNDGYALAGLVLQVATGQPFATLVETEVMKPAGMNDARMNAAAVQSEGAYAVGESSWDGKTYEPTDGYLAAPYYGPMGGAWASAADLGALAKAFLNGGGSLFGPQALAEMSQPRTATTWGARRYGLGLFVDDRSGTSVLGHSGSVAGFLSSFALVPARGLAVALLVNSDAYLPDPGELLEQAAVTFTGSALPAGEPGGFEPKSASEHVGKYQSSTLGLLEVGSSGGQMQLTIGGQAAKLTPAWRDTYFFDYQSMSLDASFWRTGGSVKYLVTAYGVGVRVP